MKDEKFFLDIFQSDTSLHVKRQTIYGLHSNDSFKIIAPIITGKRMSIFEIFKNQQYWGGSGIDFEERLVDLGMLAGGLVNKGEVITQALKREIKEEIGVKTLKLKKLTKYCPVPGYSDEIVHVYYAEVEKIKKSHLYNKFENEEIKVSKLSFNQLKKINSSEQIQNVLTKVSIYEYINKIKKN